MINTKLATAQLRLATGKRINSAADDAAGLGIATKLDFKSRGLGQVLSNIEDAKNLISVAEGHLNNIKDILAVMKTKAEQAANDTLGTDERNSILTELSNLNTQIDAEASQAKWSGVSIFGTTFNFQIGVGTGTSDGLEFNVNEQAWSNGTSTTFNSTGLGVSAGNTTSSLSASNLSTDYSVNTFATTSTTNATAGGQLDTGHYTVEVSTTGNGQATGTSLTITLRDSNGNVVNVDADGAAGGGSASSLTTTLSAGSTAVTVNLGRGFTLQLSGIATGSNESALYSVDYTASGNSVSSQGNAQSFMDAIDTANTKVATALSYIGATMNRLDYQAASLSVAQVNTEAAFNRIMNADMAFEQVQATKYSILQQTAVAMLGQANVAPQAILSLFR
jgi:flagellin